MQGFKGSGDAICFPVKPGRPVPFTLHRRSGCFNHGENLTLIKTFQGNGPGAAGGHTQTAAFAEGRIDFRLFGFFIPAGGRVRTEGQANPALAAKTGNGLGHGAADLDR